MNYNQEYINYTAFAYGDNLDEIERNALIEARTAFGPMFRLVMLPVTSMGKTYCDKERGHFCAHVNFRAYDERPEYIRVSLTIGEF